jgi:uncharacterized membrane protein
MIKDERTLNSYALRNALLLAAYGAYGIFLLPRMFSFFTDPYRGGIVWVVRSAFIILYLCYIFLAMSCMMTPSKIKSNHNIISLLFSIMLLNCLFVGFYLTSMDSLQTPPLIALSLSSLIIVGVIIYYFTKFQIKGHAALSLRNMGATLLFFSGGGEIFFHYSPYVNTIMGWFMIWMSLNSHTRPLWKSFLYSVIGSLLFYFPRYEYNGITPLDMLRDILNAQQIPPLHFMFAYLAVILVVVGILLKIKLRTVSGNNKIQELIDLESSSENDK